MTFKIEIRDTNSFIELFKETRPSHRQRLCIGTKDEINAYIKALIASDDIFVETYDGYIVVKTETLKAAGAYYTVVENMLSNRDMSSLAINFYQWSFESAKQAFDPARFVPLHTPSFIRDMLERRYPLTPGKQELSLTMIPSEPENVSTFEPVGEPVKTHEINVTKISPTAVDFDLIIKGDDGEPLDFEQVYEEARQKMLDEINKHILQGDNPVVYESPDGDESIVGFTPGKTTLKINRDELNGDRQYWYLNRVMWLYDKFKDDDNLSFPSPMI